MLTPNTEHWYRAKGEVRSRMPVFDIDGEFSHYVDRYDVQVSIIFTSFEVRRHTPKGVWIYDHYDFRERFVLRDARKRFACPTREEALESLKARTRRRALILKSQLRDAEALLEYLNDRIHRDQADLVTTRHVVRGFD